MSLEEIPKPRLIHIQCWKGRLGIGFSISEYPSIIINEILPGSLAEKSGIKYNDRILAVNGINGNSQEIAEEFLKIYAFPMNKRESMEILVADEDCYKYHTEEGIAINDKLSYIVKI